MNRVSSILRVNLLSMLNNNNPAISIVIPFFNVEDYVDDCMRSIVSQDFDKSYEAICIDDGSSDRTGMLLDQWSMHNNVYVLHTENSGLSEARNIGVRISSAPLVSFVDGDDVVSPRYLSVLYNAYGTGGNRMVIGRPIELRH